MIKIGIKNKNIDIDLTGLTNASFSKALRLLKQEGAKWDRSSKTWTLAPYKYNDIKGILEDIDVIEDNVNPEELDKLLEVKSAQIIEPTRRIPDYSIMNFKPIEGKSPNEKFQHVGISMGINRSCYAYYWGMGSGKSYVASALIAHRLLKYHDCSKVVLITSNVGVLNLYHELFKFIKDLKEEEVIIGNKDCRDVFDHKEANIVVTSYNSYRLIGNYYKQAKKIAAEKPRKPFLPLKEWSNGQPLMLILDESHNVANPKSLQSHLVTLHAPEFKYRYEFSGTPADKVEKEYTQFKILDPALVWNLSYSEWLDKLANIGTYYSRYAIREWKREEVEKQNQRFLKSYGNYYKTSDLVELPEYIEKRLYIPMSKEHRAIYETMVVNDLAQQHTVKDIVTRFPYMMLSVDAPSLLLKHEDKFDMSFNLMVNKFKDTNLAKLEAVDAIIEDHPKEKGIIWAIHPTSINNMAKRYAKYNPIVITGETPQEERFRLIEGFKKDKKHQILIANIICLNTSVTITEATYQVYVERTFDYTTYDQSTARAYRIGQKNNFTSYILLYDKSLDVLLDKSLKNKGALVKGLVSKEFLSQEQWKQIFNCTETCDPVPDLDNVI